MKICASAFESIERKHSLPVRLIDIFIIIFSRLNFMTMQSMCESDEWQYQMVKWDEWRAGDSGRKIAFIKFYLLMLRLCITKLFFLSVAVAASFFLAFIFWLLIDRFSCVRFEYLWEYSKDYSQFDRFCIWRNSTVRRRDRMEEKTCERDSRYFASHFVDCWLTVNRTESIQTNVLL